MVRTLNPHMENIGDMGATEGVVCGFMTSGVQRGVYFGITCVIYLTIIILRYGIYILTWSFYNTKDIWKLIKGVDNYEVSDLGDIKNSKTGRILKQSHRKSGYLEITLRSSGEDKTLSCHRLVALAFLPNPENKPQVDHINRVRSDNKVSNLRWATVQEQALNRSYIGYHDISRRRYI